MAKSPRLSKTAPAFPDQAAILDYIAAAPGKVTRRDIARAFKISGDDRVRLKGILRDMAAAGVLERDASKTLRPAGQLPKVAVVRIARVSDQGTLYGHADAWQGEGDGPLIRIIPDKPDRRARLPALGEGERLLARLECHDGQWRGRVIKRLERRQADIFGVFRAEPDGGGGWIEPVDKKAKLVFMVPPGDTADARDGDLVRGAPMARHQRHMGPPRARVATVLGNVDAPRSISLIAIHAHGIPTEFSPEALRQAESAAAPVLEGTMADLRDVPLITIDPEDARDHDDAVWAEADADPGNAGGWHVIVAIADVARYVLPGSALDRDARLRGNSVYFPDRVVPMLPEALSADLCSLKAGQDRAALAAHLFFDAGGRLRRHRFVRALIRVAANVSYAQVQAAVDGAGGVAETLAEPVLTPLYQAYAAVAKARAKRGPLELDLPERRVELAGDGTVAAIATRERLTAHRLVEDFMIAANVAAAEALEGAHSPLIYRVHDEPSLEKLEALRQYLESLGLGMAKGQVLKPALFNRILDQVQGQPVAEGVSDMVLRSQMQAFYTPENRGHFGLALPRYAHFTSPIRRYADLVVHRALIRGLRLGGPGALDEQDMLRLTETAEHISITERRAMAAERDSLDRYLAAYYQRHENEVLKGRVTGVTRFGLFIRVEPGGGDGFVPAASLGDEYYHHDAERQALIGEVSGEAYRLGDSVDVRVLAADRLTGALRLDMVSDAPSKMKPARSGAPRRGRHAAGPRQARGRPRRKSKGRA
ncbi:MAG: ribonuclease R [Sphingomonadales bacterium]